LSKRPAIREAGPARPLNPRAESFNLGPRSQAVTATDPLKVPGSRRFRMHSRGSVFLGDVRIIGRQRQLRKPSRSSAEAPWTNPFPWKRDTADPAGKFFIPVHKFMITGSRNAKSPSALPGPHPPRLLIDPVDGVSDAQHVGSRRTAGLSSNTSSPWPFSRRRLLVARCSRGGGGGGFLRDPAQAGNRRRTPRPFAKIKSARQGFPPRRDHSRADRFETRRLSANARRCPLARSRTRGPAGPPNTRGTTTDDLRSHFSPHPCWGRLGNGLQDWLGGQQRRFPFGEPGGATSADPRPWARGFRKLNAAPFVSRRPKTPW